MKMSVFVLNFASVLISSVLFLSACNTSDTKTTKKPSPVLTVNNRPKPTSAPEVLVPGPLTENAEKKQSTRFFYNARGRRDPFQSIVISQGLRKQAPVSGSVPPLQRKDISDLKLIGIIWGAFGPKAIITTSSGKGYTVDIGTRIGVNHGVIREITQNEVLVEETLLNIFGEPRKSKVVMMLHSEKERVE